MTAHLVACGPAGFAGAGRIMCNGLHSAAERGVKCTYVGPSTPFPWLRKGSGKVAVQWRAGPVASGAIGSGSAITNESVLLILELADELMRAVRSAAAAGSPAIIWAHYLFPYGAAGLLATNLLRSMGVPVRCWLNPAGSDIWEVAPQLREAATGILRHPQVDRIITYSLSFADEIAAGFSAERPIDVLPPCIDGACRPLPATDRAAARRRLGLPADGYVISMHSNMRPVKAPEDVLCVARRVAGLLESRDVVLLLAGPARSMSSGLSPLDVRRLGLLADVTEVLQVADVEINLSRHDSFNLSLAEAMGCGVPVVTTDVVGIAPDIRSCGAGITVPLESTGPHDPRRFYATAVEALCRFGIQEAERVAAGRRAGEHASVLYSDSAYYSRLQRLVSADLTAVSSVQAARTGGDSDVVRDRVLP